MENNLSAAGTGALGSAPAAPAAAPPIKPTVGRVVWFHPASNSRKSGFEPTEICAAIVARVLPDGKLNLGVFDGNGESFPMAEVPLIQDGETAPKDGFYAEWMPFQKGQALAQSKA